MAIDTNIIISTNLFAGFQNYKFATASISIDDFFGLPPGTSIIIAKGDYAGPIPIVIPLDNTNAISIIQIQYQGLDSFVRLLPGSITINYPTAATATYQIQSVSYYKGGNLMIDTYIVNLSGGNVTIPPITIACQAGLYQAPF